MPTVPKAEQSQKTRRALLDAARELFAERGYAATATEEIVQCANVTRGALQYHYGEKIGLFRAVFDELRDERVQLLMERIQAAEGDVWEKYAVTGCRAFIDSAKDPAVQRILYIDAPAVLGMSTIRDNAPGLLFLRTVFTQLMDEGLIRKMPVLPLSAILWAASLEAGRYIAQAAADDLAQVEQETVAVLLEILSALRLSPE